MYFSVHFWILYNLTQREISGFTTETQNAIVNSNSLATCAGGKLVRDLGKKQPKANFNFTLFLPNVTAGVFLQFICVHHKQPMLAVAVCLIATYIATMYVQICLCVLVFCDTSDFYLPQNSPGTPVSLQCLFVCSVSGVEHLQNKSKFFSQVETFSICIQVNSCL